MAWSLALIGVVFVVGVVVLLIRVPRSSEVLRRRIVDTLAWRLDSQVELASLDISAYPSLRAAGTGLVIRKHGTDPQYPPLITIRSFAVEANVLGLLRKRVAHVTLDGLDIEIPPGNHDDQPSDSGRATPGGRPSSPSAADAPRADPAQPPAPASARPEEPRTDRSLTGGVVIETLDTTGARLAILSREPGKAAKVWDIHQLRMHDVGIDQSMPFEATLTNAVPPGEIQTSGRFGPWQRDQPERTPLSGSFTFDHADLSVFHGISGILSAHGTFGGALGRIDINGETDTPDFTVTVGNHPLPLHTKYHSIVDGTNGNTYLERIDGQFLKTSLVAKGSVVDARGAHGRVVTLDVTMDSARVEDVLKMAVKGPSPLVGGLKLATKFVLPPGETDVVDRLQLDGHFSMAQVRFTSYDVQAKIDELSHRARARDADTKPESVASNFTGRFKLGNGRLSLPALTFSTPGAGVQLAGAYNLKSEGLDFQGSLLMDATISETQRGIRRLLLKVIDPLFKKDGGGSEIPIKVGGTWKDPHVGLDLHRVIRFGGGDEKPRATSGHR